MSIAISISGSEGVLSRTASDDVLLAYGKVKPEDDSSGYATGCLFLHTNGAAGSVVYVNEGTNDNSDFNALETPETITASQISIVDAGGFTTATNVESALAELLESYPASKVTIADAGGFTATTDAESALAEIYQHLLSGSGGFIDLPLTCWREVNAAGSVGNSTANGGVLATDTTPVFAANGNEAMYIVWATGNVDAIAIAVTLPADFDGTSNCFVDLFVQSAPGSTDAPSFTVETSWDGAAKVSDTATGTTSVSLHTATATIAAADIPDAPLTLTIGLTPGTHSTDVWILNGARLRHKRKLLTS
jgi:hypothetical protein